MTKEVLIKISGVQMTAEENPEPVEVITSGEYYFKNGKHYILYDEVMEGFSEVTKNRIKIEDNYVDITKKGVSNVYMVFEKNKKNVCFYETPYGSLLVGVNARHFLIDKSEENIDVKIDYTLEVNNEHLADCSITMNIKSKEAEGFSLL